MNIQSSRFNADAIVYPFSYGNGSIWQLHIIPQLNAGISVQMMFDERVGREGTLGQPNQWGLPLA